MAPYRHLHLRNLGRESVDFRPAGGGSDRPPRAISDRRRHARRLRGDLANVVAALDDAQGAQKAAGVVLNKRGIPVAAEGIGNQYIVAGDLKLKSRGLQLLSLKRRRDKPDVANFFVTRSSAQSLLRALGKYEEWRRGDKPMRFNLFESLQSFRPATIEDLWNDSPSKLPEDGYEAEWEIWIRRDEEDLFTRCVEGLGLTIHGDKNEFVDTAIFNVLATREAVERLVLVSAAVIELRSASSFVSSYLDYDPEERAAAVEDLLPLIYDPPAGAPITTLMDTGVNYANPLLGMALSAADCQTINSDWPVNDHAGHGTNMAGIALYGDLEQFIASGLPLVLTTALESVVVTAPEDMPPIPARDAVQQAIALVANDDRQRVFCLAATAPGDTDDGRQSALSAAVDLISWNDGQDTRLMCVAAGNAQANVDGRYPIGPYDARNAEYRIESPGQAVNALTIGAATMRSSAVLELLAPEGDLSPTSRTSQGWEVHHAYKPDLVMEGGNHLLDNGSAFSYDTEETMLLTTGRNVPSRPFSFTGETSAATARAAGLSTRLLADYPDFRAETLRALMVQSCDWTPAMVEQYQQAQAVGLNETDALVHLLSSYGWGMPDEERLFRNAGDALTLVVEDELSPYLWRNGRVALKQMKYFILPWPEDELRRLDQEDVEMRCTLSYFAQPDPQAASRSRVDRYCSHRLRFSVKTADENHLEAQQRVNLFASEEDVDDLEDQISTGAGQDEDTGWILGDRRRRRGTLHHDIWRGKAYDLAGRNGISVYPVRGWYAERRDPSFWDRSVNFSLVVSIRTASTDVDLMAEAATKVPAGTLVNATPIPVRSR